MRLAGLDSVFALIGTSSADKKASIHALNRFLLSNNTQISTQFFNYALILLSLEHVELQSASTPPRGSLHQPHSSALLFDHPFNMDIVSEDKSLVSVSQSEASRSSCCNKSTTGAMHNSCILNVNKPLCNLEDFSTLEVYEFNSLLQELVSAHTTHPYLDIYEHQHSESIVVVCHTGFDGSPVHTYKTSSHIHTKVGFQNYLQYIMKMYGDLIDETVGEDVKRREEYESMMKDKQQMFTSQELKKVSEQKQQEQEQLQGPEQQEKMVAVAGEPSVTTSSTSSSMSCSSGGKSKKRDTSVSKDTPLPETASIKKKSKVTLNDGPTIVPPMPDLKETGLQFEIPKRFTGYDLGDVVVVKESVHTTVFTADGVTVRSTTLLPFDDDGVCCSDISMLHNGHSLNTSQMWAVEEPEKIQEDLPPRNILPAVAGIPQPPPGLQYAALTACFSNSLQLSCSYFGPKGNGELPFLPYRPSILDLSDSEIPIPFSTSPKLSKKQLEQQQLLEQQRLQEVRQERQAAQEKYDCSYTRLLRNNKYQQLFVSTEGGLKVHCQAMVDLATDPSIKDGSDACTVVKQWYCNADKVAHLSEHTKERYRYYHPEGYVVKHMADKTMMILSADGSKYCPATSKEIKLFQEKYHTSVVQMEQDHNSIDQSATRMTSATKVTFAESHEDSSTRIWCVTAPMGKSYLWQEAREREKVEDENTTETASKVSTSICSEAQHKNAVVELDSLCLLKATDQVTGEVHTSARCLRNDILC